MGKSTPWGPAERTEQVAPGIVFFSTASHGGYRLSQTRLAEMPDYLRDARHITGPWFEEDCEAALVVLAFPEDFPEGAADRAAESVARWFPRTLEAHKAAKEKQAFADDCQKVIDETKAREGGEL